ncbi:MAG: glycosyltransferase family 4 protein [Patescibacteria group bacterium]
MKKVLIFSLAYFPKHVGGAEVAIKEITDRLPASEFEFHMVTNRFDSTLPRIEKVGNVTVHRIGFVTKNPTIAALKKFPLHLNKVLFQFYALITAVTLHRTHHFDMVWSMMAHSTGVPGGLFKTLYPQVKYVLTLQEGDPPEYIEKKMAVFGPLFKRAFTKADRIQVISNFLGAWARRMGYTGSVVLVPNAVDAAHFAKEYSEGELQPLKEELQKKHGDVFLITASRLVKKNALDDVIRALPLLPPNVHFIIAGIGHDEEALRALVEELQVVSRVRFVGFVNHTNLPRYLKVSDIFIRPSLSEGFGSSFVEAFAAGLPVIATQEGGIADFLFDPVRNPETSPTGRAVDARSPEQIARAVTLYMSDEEMTKKIIENARAVAFSRYDWNNIAAQMKENVFGGF